MHPNYFDAKMNAFVFPGQGAQFSGMGRDLYDKYAQARETMNEANRIIGFSLTDIMFDGTDDDLRQTRVTQPAIFLHSVVSAMVNTTIRPDMVAGHSLGEFSALVASGAVAMNDALLLVRERAEAMQEACDRNPGTMAAVLSLSDDKVAEVCANIDGVGPANYNCPGQVVISGTIVAIEEACAKMKEAGAKRALRLPVGGAFHSPLMAPAAERLEQAILRTEIHRPICPIYQNVCAAPVMDPEQIRRNLIAQLTSPVRWTESVQRMIADGADTFYEFGPGDVLKGLIHKINPNVTAQ